MCWWHVLLIYQLFVNCDLIHTLMWQLWMDFYTGMTCLTTPTQYCDICDYICIQSWYLWLDLHTVMIPVTTLIHCHDMPLHLCIALTYYATAVAHCCGICIHVNPERSFRGTNGGPSNEERRALEGGSGGAPPEFFKNLYCKWCNVSYSWAIFVNTISHCNTISIISKLQNI